MAEALRGALQLNQMENPARISQPTPVASWPLPVP